MNESSAFTDEELAATLRSLDPKTDEERAMARRQVQQWADYIDAEILDRFLRQHHPPITTGTAL